MRTHEGDGHDEERELSLQHIEQAEALRESGDLKAAVASYQKALEVREALLETTNLAQDQLRLAYVYSAIGEVLALLGKQEASDEYHEYSLLQTKEAYGKEQNADTTSAYALALSAQAMRVVEGEHPEACTILCSEALSLAQDMYAEYESAEAISTLAVVYGQYGLSQSLLYEAEDAIKYLENSAMFCSMMLETSDDEDALTLRAPFLSELVTLYCQTKNFAKAFDIVSRELGAYNNTPATERWHKATSLCFSLSERLATMANDIVEACKAEEVSALLLPTYEDTAALFPDDLELMLQLFNSTFFVARFQTSEYAPRYDDLAGRVASGIADRATHMADDATVSVDTLRDTVELLYSHTRSVSTEELWNNTRTQATFYELCVHLCQSIIARSQDVEDQRTLYAVNSSLYSMCDEEDTPADDRRRMLDQLVIQTKAIYNESSDPYDQLQLLLRDGMMAEFLVDYELYEDALPYAREADSIAQTLCTRDQWSVWCETLALPGISKEVLGDALVGVDQCDEAIACYADAKTYLETTLSMMENDIEMVDMLDERLHCGEIHEQTETIKEYLEDVNEKLAIADMFPDLLGEKNIPHPQQSHEELWQYMTTMAEQGEKEREHGDADAAMLCFLQAQLAAKACAEGTPHIDARKELGHMCLLVGEAARNTERLEDAIAFLEEAEDIFAKLLPRYADPDIKRWIFQAQASVARAYVPFGDKTKAKAAYERALKSAKALAPHSMMDCIQIKKEMADL